MPAKSSNASYGTVAVTIHWLTVLLILSLLGLGFSAAQTTDPAAKASILQFHIPLGMMVFLLTLFRIVWWWFDRKPAPVGSDPRWQQLSAKAVHVLFYVVILGMAVSGMGMLVLSGAGPTLFSAEQQALPDFHQYLPRVPHGIGARLIFLLLIFHAGAALFHHFVKRDATLKRMWFKRNDAN